MKDPYCSSCHILLGNDYREIVPMYGSSRYVCLACYKQHSDTQKATTGCGSELDTHGDIGCYHKDTCISDYLTDHHNRDGECLVGISVYGQDARQACDDLISEIRGCDYGIPESITEQDLYVAARVAVTNVDFRPYDEDGNPVAECDVPPEVWEHILDQCESQAYFVFTWDPEKYRG